MRDEKEERKKQARSNKQTRQSNTAHPRQSLFLEKISCLGWDSNPRHSTLYTLDRALYQLSYRGSSAGWAQISHLIVHLMNMYAVYRTQGTCTMYICMQYIGNHYFLAPYLAPLNRTCRLITFFFCLGWPGSPLPLSCRLEDCRLPGEQASRG